MHLRSSALSLAPTLALLAAAPAFAQEAPEVVVTGRGLADAPGDRALAVVEIDRARIDQNIRLESVLADVAGLQQFRRSDSRSANPTSQGITLRGLGGNAASRALLILDGVPQTDPFGGWVAFPAYATDRLGRVRVTRGGGSGFYGPGALAGTIELESAAPGSLATGNAATLAYGSRDSLDGRATAALVRPGGFATLSGAYARGDGFIPTVAEDRGPVDRPAPYEQASGALRTVIAVARRHRDPGQRLRLHRSPRARHALHRQQERGRRRQPARRRPRRLELVRARLSPDPRLRLLLRQRRRGAHHRHPDARPV